MNQGVALQCSHIVGMSFLTSANAEENQVLAHYKLPKIV
jgi:hypothetical protein